MLTYAKKGPDEFAEWLATESGFLGGLASWDGDPLVLEPYQRAFLESEARLRLAMKARQTGMSFIMSAEAVARGHLRDGHTAIFVSYNLGDAKEKIRYARQFWEELPLAYQRRLVTDSKSELAFEGKKKPSRIISGPCRPPRGKHGDIYLDEAAFYPNDREVYAGSTALIARSRGQLTLCSTPLGRRGIFWEIALQEMRAYPRYMRQNIPWWLCPLFCHSVEAAADRAPEMETEERIAEFGTNEIKIQYDAMEPDDFAQEFEVAFVSDVGAFYPWETIVPCIDHSFTERALESLPVAKGGYRAGYDVARKRDASCLAIFDDSGTKKPAGIYSWQKMKFADQKSRLRAFLSRSDVIRLNIDANGIGANLAEDLEDEFPSKVVPRTMSNSDKDSMARALKIQLQQKQTLIPPIRDLAQEIPSVKKQMSASGNPIYTVGASTPLSPHGDRYWAICLAVRPDVTRVRNSKVSVRVISARKRVRDDFFSD